MPLILSGSNGLSGNVGTTTKEMLPAGTVIQVVQAVKTDVFSTSSQAFVTVTGLSLSITPLSATSKILVVSDVAIGPEASNAVIPRLTRNGTPIYVGDAAGVRPIGMGQYYPANSAGIVKSGGYFLDSPNTTSPVLYEFQMRTTGVVVQYVNRTNRDSNLADYDARGSSSITLMEIKA